MAQRYWPRAPVSVASIAAFAAAGLGAALIIATVFWLSSPMIANWPIVAPAVRAVLLGATLAYLVIKLRLARPRATTILAVTLTALMELGLCGLQFREARAQCLAEAEQEAAASVALGGRPTHRWCPGAIDLYRAEHSTSFLGAGAHGALDLLELFLAAVIAALLTRAKATEPCCDRCGRWLVESPIGSARHGVADGFVRQLLAGKPEVACALLCPADTREETLLSLAECPQHSSEHVLRVREKRFQRRNRALALRHCADLWVSSEELEAVREALAHE
jgi:hypothetical protein